MAAPYIPEEYGRRRMKHNQQARRQQSRGKDPAATARGGLPAKGKITSAADTTAHVEPWPEETGSRKSGKRDQPEVWKAASARPVEKRRPRRGETGMPLYPCRRS